MNYENKLPLFISGQGVLLFTTNEKKVIICITDNNKNKLFVNFNEKGVVVFNRKYKRNL